MTVSRQIRWSVLVRSDRTRATDAWRVIVLVAIVEMVLNGK